MQPPPNAYRKHAHRNAAFAAGAAVAAALLLAGCGTDGDTAAPEWGCDGETRAANAPASKADPQAVLRGYVELIGQHRFDDAAGWTRPCTRRDWSSLRRLWNVMSGFPAQKPRLAIERDDASTARAQRYRVTIWVRLGRPPYAAWISASKRTFELRRTGRRWFVAADVTRRAGGRLAPYGLSTGERPLAIEGRRATVLYSSTAATQAAELVLRTADASAARLYARYGTPTASPRAVLFLVNDQRQGERLAHISLGIARTPAGFQYSAYAYINYAEWDGYGRRDQRAIVVHELTHVVTRPFTDGAPHSLAEGVAMYEEDAFRRRTGGRRIPLELLRTAYTQGFPSEAIWRRHMTDWGLADPLLVQLCYLDAMATVRTVVERYGGLPALERLGHALRRASHGRRDLTGAELDAAFRSALGAGFAEVARRTRADVLG